MQAVRSIAVTVLSLLDVPEGAPITRSSEAIA
jgi:hypothetical protein